MENLKTELKKEILKKAAIYKKKMKKKILNLKRKIKNL